MAHSPVSYSEQNLSKMNRGELFKIMKEMGIKMTGLKKKKEMVDQILASQSSIVETVESNVIMDDSDADVNDESQSDDLECKISNIEIKNCEGLEYMKTIENNSIDLVLTDPPYIISRESGMDKHYHEVKQNEENGIKYVKTEQEWTEYKNDHNIQDDKQKDNFMKYGSVYGKKYCVKTDYGSWDSDFTLDILDQFVAEYYKKLRKGGTLIIFFDLWKLSELKDIMEKNKFKQLRFIEWIKTNPQPRNSNVNYLTNCREIALLGVKQGGPTFNSSYDNGIYSYPLQGGKNRFHPTQKSLPLTEDLIKKHSNEGDMVLDTFSGAGTTAIACKNTNRSFKGCEISKEYYEKIINIINED